MNDLLNRVLEAHGGLERWHKVESLDVRVTITGALFQYRRAGSQNPLDGRVDRYRGGRVCATPLRLSTQVPDVVSQPLSPGRRKSRERPALVWMILFPVSHCSFGTRKSVTIPTKVIAAPPKTPMMLDRFSN